MCGIAGYSGDFPGSLLGRFVERLAHRGPDGTGVWHDAAAQVGLAHTRLSILDLSPRGRQPMVDPQTGCRIVYNGELFNFRALRRELERGGHTFTSESDTEVLLRLYVARGAAMLDALDGIFAFALWDPRSRELLLARDALGVKPLYWTAPSSGGVMFASEIKALLASPAVVPSLDLAAIDATIAHLWCPGPRTALAGVSKLEPGTAMVVRGGEVARLWRWFELPVQAPAGTPAPADPVAAVRAAVERAVTDQLVSDVPVGAFLSGGLDSSTVAAIASRSVPRLPCFSLRLADGVLAAEGFEDDLPYAREVARHLGAELIEVPIGSDVAGELEAMVYQLDEPQADLAPLSVRSIAEAARDRGIKVLLSGAGGDDVFAGYRRHQAAAFDRWWSWLPRPARRGLRLAAGHLPAAMPTMRRVRKVLRGADGDADHRVAAYFDWIDGPVRRQLFTAEAAAAIDAAPYHPLEQSLRRLRADVEPVNRTAYLDLRYFLPDHNLNYTDKMAMAAGVEVRVPLVSRGLVELAATLPVRAKLRGTTGKWVLREAARPLLPPSVLARAKTGFGIPLRSWLHGGLAPLARDVLSPAGLRATGIFDGAAVERLWQDDRAGRVDAAYPLLAILCVELWWRRMRSANTAAAPAPEPPRLNAAVT